MKNYLGQSVSPGLLQILQESVMWPNRSITGLFLQPTLMHNSITTCMSDYYPRHVSGLDMPILRRNNCTNTASGILALISGCTLHRLRVVYSRLWERGYQMLCLYICSSWGWACQGPKHVEDSNVTYMLLLNCALKFVEEIILYYDARLIKHQITWKRRL